MILKTKKDNGNKYRKPPYLIQFRVCFVLNNNFLIINGNNGIALNALKNTKVDNVYLHVVDNVVIQEENKH